MSQPATQRVPLFSAPVLILLGINTMNFFDRQILGAVRSRGSGG